MAKADPRRTSRKAASSLEEPQAVHLAACPTTAIRAALGLYRAVLTDGEEWEETEREGVRDLQQRASRSEQAADVGALGTIGRRS